MKDCAKRWDDVVRHTCEGHSRGVTTHRCPCGSVLITGRSEQPLTRIGQAKNDPAGTVLRQDEHDAECWITPRRPDVCGRCRWLDGITPDRPHASDPSQGVPDA